MEYTPQELDKLVKKFMHEGKSPSQIDKILEIRPGMAHDVVIHLWRRHHGALG